MLSRKKFLKLGGLAILGASYPILIERNIVLENHYNLYFKDLPEAFHDFKILQLTDTHLGQLVSKSFIYKVVHRSNLLNLDMIVCTGDYVHRRNHSDEIDAVWPILMKLRARFGVYSVLGNHDHWADEDRSLSWLQRSGQNLRHRKKKIQLGQDHIWIGGAGDLWEDKLEIDRTFQNVPARDFKILLAHNPDSVDQAFSTKLNLVVSGHTHGGQIIIPFLGPPIVPVKNKLYTSGVIQLDAMQLFISRGIGYSIFPVRANCYPEIAILHLKRKII